MDKAPHVLLAEDTAPLAEALKMSLEGFGMHVTLALDGWSAARVLAQGTIDVLVTDYFLPGLTGSQLCFLVRDNYTRRRLPVIMITGKTHELDQKWLIKEHNLVALLPKPIKPKELADLIAACYAEPANSLPDLQAPNEVKCSQVQPS